MSLADMTEPRPLATYELWEISKRRRRISNAMCQFCIYWEPDHWQDEKKLAETPEQLFFDVRGECHRHAPMAHDNVGGDVGRLVGEIALAANMLANIEPDEHTSYHFEDKDQHYVYEWPMTEANAWCGEFHRGRVPPSSEELAELEAQSKKDYG